MNNQGDGRRLLPELLLPHEIDESRPHDFVVQMDRQVSMSAENNFRKLVWLETILTASAVLLVFVGLIALFHAV